MPGLGRMQFNFGQRPLRYSDDRVLQNRVERHNFGHSQTEKATLYEYLHTNSIDTRFDRWISGRSIRLRDRDPCFMISGQHALVYAAPSASLVICFLFALWVGRRLESRFILHGMLVGVVATLLYVGLTLARPEPFAYLVAHGLKVLGGAGGGAFAGWRRAATNATDVASH